MKENRLILFFLVVSQFALSQIKGVVKDSLSGEPIPYVNIWVENETIGTISEIDGSFVLTTSSDKNIVFSILGYNKKTLKANQTEIVLLNPTIFDLKEMVILNKKETKQVEIGTIKNSTFQAFDNGPKVEAKFFPYDKSYSKTRFIKEVTIFTDSRIDNATIKLHFYSVDDNGAPGEELLTKDYIVTLTKGVIKHKFNLSQFDLEFPKNGLFVAYEKLLIEQNKQGTKYQPYVLYNYVARDFFYTYSYGKWQKEAADYPQKLGINEPAINLILSN
ncbi:carboxypeptidase-like regulatory domain-containing protein [Flavobacterium sp.]|jgi:hypothetical protein|uniref:carboxypeptidase-like regulatory domain-containing protein n=1 Tax=Flavobacterium sp. TaxID=239 RepID=UPI0037C1720E